MTQEEILLKIRERIAALSHNASQMCEEYEGYRLACMDISDILDEITKELSKPSLPSNLDEAAEEELDDVDANWQIDERDDGCTEPGYNQKQMLLMFKAGAEWMAGQGTTVRKKIGKIDDGGNQIPTYCNGFEVTELDVPFLNSKECGYGNEVIVQIRKKQ